MKHYCFSLSFILLLSAKLTTADEVSFTHSHSVEGKEVAETPLGFSLTDGWLDSWPHRHFSLRNTPFIHTFSLEPAFLDRDLFLDARLARADAGDELEIEAEVEWALTRRIGLALEAPYVRLNPDDGDTESGIGDVAIAPRFLIGETGRFLLSANLEIGIPTGDDARELGSGEVSLAPSLSAWLDLGNWFSSGAQLGTEHGLESGESEFFYNVALGYSFLTQGSRETLVSRHFPRGMSNLIVEFTGRTALEGEEKGRHNAEVLFGASYNIDGIFEIRGGYQVPIGGPKKIDDGFLLGLIYHF